MKKSILIVLAASITLATCLIGIDCKLVEKWVADRAGYGIHNVLKF